MASTNPPLDELQHRRPEVIQWWVDEGGQPMDENMIHRYLSESPFFDHTTKNGLTVAQAQTNKPAYDLVANRRDFEAQLSKQRGNEYMIVGEPQRVSKAEEGKGVGYAGSDWNGMWAIRKQTRDRRRGVDGREEESLTTLGTYYIVGENMYQAPSVGDIVGNRLLSAATSLSKFFDQAVDLPSFSPTSGYSYLPHQASKPPPPGAGSTTASPTRSREGSVAPDTQSLRSTSLAPPDTQPTTSITAQTAQDARLLASSLKLALEFSDEYTDENPLLGEPGHFSFTSTTSQVKKRKADELAAEKAKEEQQQRSRATSPAAKVEEKTAPSPPAVMTESKASAAAGVKERERKGSRMEKVKRKKSRGASLANVVTSA